MNPNKYTIIFFISLFFSSGLLFSLEKDNRAVINMAWGLYILDNGQIWITTRDDELFIADSFDSDFKLIKYCENLTPPPKMHYTIRNIENQSDNSILITRDIIGRGGLTCVDYFLSSDNGNRWSKIDSLETIILKNQNKMSDGWIKDTIKPHYYKFKLLSKSLLLDDIGKLWLISENNERKFLVEDIIHRNNIIIDSNLKDFFVLNRESIIYRYKENKLDSTYLYTYSNEIIPPKETRVNGDFKWGFTDKHLYYSYKAENYWYRQDVFDFAINDIHFYDSENIILWDGKWNNYKYNTSDKSISEFKYNSDFIKEFFDYDLTVLKIYSGYSSCMSIQKSSVDFESEGKYLKSKISNFNTIYEDSYPSNYVRTITKDSITNILTDNILRNLSSFQISDYKDQATINGFLETREWIYEQEDFRTNNTIDEYRKLDENFVKLLDTLSQETAEYILGFEIEPYTLLGSWFVFKLKNSNNDSLIVETSEQSRNNPFNLPLIVQFNSSYNLTYNKELTKFFASLVPEKFYNVNISKQSVLESLYYKLIEMENEKKKLE